MNGLPADFDVVLDALRRRTGASSPGLGMLDDRDGPATLSCTSSSERRRRGRVHRWVAIMNLSPSPDSHTTVWWMLDGRTTRWAREQCPTALRRGSTGLDSERHPVLWFRTTARRSRAWRPWTAAGVFAAGGIVDSATVRVRARPMTRRTQLRLILETGMWGLSGPDWELSGPSDPDMRCDVAPRLAITVSGAIRPVEWEFIESWR